MSKTFDSEAGESSGTGPPTSDAAGGSAASSECQDNAAAGVGQPNESEQPSHWPARVPWVVLGVPLAFELAAVVYEQSQDWGFLGNLWLIFVVAGVGLATTLWLAAWLLLSTWPVRGRAVYFAVGLASLAAITSPTIPWWEGEWELNVWLAIVVIGVWLPQYLWRQRGWRISLAASGAASEAVNSSPWLRFSIRDILVLTTGIAVLLGLVLTTRGELNRFTVALVSGQIVAASLVFWFALAWRSYRAAIGASALSVVVVSLAGTVISEPRRFFEPSVHLLGVCYTGPATIAALTIIALVRSAGYRLRRSES